MYWLQRLNFKILLLVYKALDGFEPEHISDPVLCYEASSFISVILFLLSCCLILSPIYVHRFIFPCVYFILLCLFNILHKAL